VLLLSEDRAQNIEADSLTILRVVPFEQGFHFTNKGVYEGQTATSLEDFAEKLKQAPAESIEFHFKRRDFNRWISDTVGDWFLASELDFYLAPDSSGEEIREKLLPLVDARLTDLKTQRHLM
jgi:hypothetical protein